jgi:Protein of unknown function (DUF2612)
MTMTPFNGDIHQSLKWMQNNAPNIQTLIQQKSDWYSQYHTSFWTGWEANIFDLRTANTFGLMIWCIILGVPSTLFGLYPNNVSWAYGNQRQNYIADDANSPTTNPNEMGGNFYGGGDSTVLNLDEVRWALQLRYVALVSDGRISFINTMLRFIFNQGQPWSFPGKRYFYLTDITAPAQTLTPSAPVTTAHYMEYRVGLNLPISAQFINLLNSAQYGFMPSCAGTRYQVIQES